MLTRAAMILAALLLSVSCFAQEPDSAFHRIGVFADLDGSFIDRVGVKYRLSRTSTLFLRTRIFYDNRSSNNPNDFVEQNDLGVDLSLGLERSVVNVGHVSLLVFGSVGGSWSEDSRSDVILPATTPGTIYRRSTAVALVAGFVVEYAFTDQISVAIRHSTELGWTWNRTITASHGGSSSLTKHTYVELGDVVTTLSLYF